MAPFIEKACARSYGCYTPDWIGHQIATRQFQLWAGADADALPRVAMVTHLNEYPSGVLAAQIVLLGGEGILFAEQAMMIDVVKRWARGQGATRLEYAGREGFLRACPGGWKRTSINAVMELDADG